MLISDGGGGYAGITNWYAYNTEQMWRLIENQQTDNHWKQVTGWKKISELTSEHGWRVKEYRDNLAAAWPPEKNPAAKAFIDRLDNLIKHVKSVSDVASANYTIFSTATGDISTSRQELKKLYNEYLVKKQQKEAYDQAVRSIVPSPGPSPTPSPSPGTPATPKVTEADLEQINHKARSVMYSLSSTLVESKAKLRPIEPYQAARDDHDPSGKDRSGNGSYNQPMIGDRFIPPVIPVPVERTFNPYPPITQPPPIVVPAPSPPGLGPVLGGVGPLAPPAPVNPIPPGMITPPAAPGLGPGLSPGLPPIPMMPGTGGTGSGASGQSGPPRGAGSLPRPGVGGGTAGMPRTAMPPGGMIGGTPGRGLGQPGAGMAAPRRINPVGGVIGGGAGTTPMSGGSQRPGTGTGRTLMGGGGHGTGPGHGAATSGRPVRRRDEHEGEQQWDPENPWETDEGVAPVVLPARETGRIDPGPAIGFNR